MIRNSANTALLLIKHRGYEMMKCDCWQCHIDQEVMIERMITCAKCGNKRCPKANNHRNGCTNSNESGQVGSAYFDTNKQIKE